MHRKPKLILHVGCPKTASTTFQYQLANNRKVLNKLGFDVPPRFILKGDVHNIHTLLTKSRNIKNTDETILDMQSELRSLIDLYPSGLILSNESCLGEPFMKGRKTFFPLAGQSAINLRKMLEGYDVYILVVLRTQCELVRSYYSQVLRHGRKESFNSYCNEIKEIDMSWQEYLNKLELITDSKNITIVHFNDLRKDINLLFSLTLNILGVDNNNSQNNFKLTSKKRNPSLPPISFGLIRLINKIFNGKFNLLRRNTIDVIGRIIPSSLGKLESNHIRNIEQLYKNNNAVFINNTPMTLESYKKFSKKHV